MCSEELRSQFSAIASDVCQPLTSLGLVSIEISSECIEYQNEILIVSIYYEHYSFEIACDVIFKERRYGISYRSDDGTANRNFATGSADAARRGLMQIREMLLKELPIVFQNPDSYFANYEKMRSARIHREWESWEKQVAVRQAKAAFRAGNNDTVIKLLECLVSSLTESQLKMLDIAKRKNSQR